MKVLNVEDNPIKHCQIRRALEQCGVKEVDCCNNLQDALYLLEERTGMGRRYDLIVTDMNYPLEKGGETCGQAGEILSQRIKEDGIEIPIIICSSRRFSSEGILGSVWYSELRDIEEDFRKVLWKI